MTVKIPPEGSKTPGMSTLDSYLNRLVLAGYRPATVKARAASLGAFARTVPDITTATREDCERYLARPTFSARTRRSYCSHLRSFYGYLIDEQLRTDDPTARLPKFRAPMGLPRPISHTDLITALDNADRRMKAFLLLMALGGLRCMEVAGLAPDDIIHTESGTVLLQVRETKGGGNRSVPAHPAVLEALAMLPVEDGRWWTMTRGSVSTAVNRYLRSLGLRATSHQLRHWAGTSWIEASGYDLLTTAALLGHANVATAQNYTRVNPARPAEVVGLMPWPGRPAA